MRGLSGALDHHENARHLLAADSAVHAHTRRVHFPRPMASEAVEQVAKRSIRAAVAESLGKGWRTLYDNVLDTRVVRGTGRVTGQAVVSAGLITGGLLIFTGMAGLVTDEATDFATEKPLAAAGLGIGMLLGVSALGIVLFRRISGGSS